MNNEQLANEFRKKKEAEKQARYNKKMTNLSIKHGYKTRGNLINNAAKQRSEWRESHPNAPPMQLNEFVNSKFFMNPATRKMRQEENRKRREAIRLQRQQENRMRAEANRKRQEANRKIREAYEEEQRLAREELKKEMDKIIKNLEHSNNTGTYFTRDGEILHQRDIERMAKQKIYENKLKKTANNNFNESEFENAVNRGENFGVNDPNSNTKSTASNASNPVGGKRRATRRKNRKTRSRK